ncbi:MAG: class I tRNA ligase family protein, partial [Chthoniobacterales bacterium]
VFYLTGVDQHGQKVQQSADKAGIAPQQFVDELTAKFIALWEKLDVRYDRWAATTDPIHQTCVQGILQRLYDEGQIYQDKQDGYYSIRQEQFLTDKERGADGEFGPEWGQVEHREEENYYFKLEQHKQWLLDYLKSPAHQDCVTPDFRQTELINAVEKLSGDLCISRPKKRLSWGIELPFDPDYVTYVWFDALTNYISFIGYDPAISDFSSQDVSFLEKWPALHIIGKDILIPAHGIYWPIMLKALGFPDEQMPRFLVHGWWNISGAKMSKSLGNVIDPDQLADKYGPEALRYYLIGEIPAGNDADFAEDRLVGNYNAYLANKLGNLLNRLLNMSGRYRSGRIKWANRTWQPPLNDEEASKRIEDAIREKGLIPLTLSIPNLQYEAEKTIRSAIILLDAFRWAVALNMLNNFTVFCNQMIEIIAPWTHTKNPEAAEMVDDILYGLAESLRIIAILISPVLPKAAHGIFDQLNWKMETELAGKEERFALTDAEWGKLPDGHVVGKPTPLFPRIETAEAGAKTAG